MTENEIDERIKHTEAKFAGAEVVFSKAHENYLAASDAFRRASIHRERLAADLLSLKQARARARAEAEFEFEVSGI